MTKENALLNTPPISEPTATTVSLIAPTKLDAVSFIVDHALANDSPVIPIEAKPLCTTPPTALKALENAPPIVLATLPTLDAMLEATPVIPSFTEVKIFPAASESFGKNPCFLFGIYQSQDFVLGHLQIKRL